MDSFATASPLSPTLSLQGRGSGCLANAVSTLTDRLREHARLRPTAPALRDGDAELDYKALDAEVERLADRLDAQRVGLLLDNGLAWACLDLALLRRGAVCVPMPGFFTADQLAHLIEDADLDMVVTDTPARVAALLDGPAPSGLEVAGRPVWLFRRDGAERTLPAETAKITYTSGTTGTPKGVCLSAAHIEAVAATLANTVGASDADRSLALLPLSTLLENIGGLYAPLWVGALAQLPSMAECGIAGSSGLDAHRLFAALRRYDPSSIILVPQLLKVLTGYVEAGLPLPESLRFVAVGGAPVSADLLERARRLGIPVCEGYGLSEAGSVVCLNRPGEEPVGVGRPLPHVEVRIAADGEVMVRGRLFLGYLGGDGPTGDIWPTGDLGRLDADGRLHLTGRKKTAYATAYGRNVSPEWVEGALAGHPRIAQAAVFGEGMPYNVAVLVVQGSTPPDELAEAVDAVNDRLPDYARVARWVVAAEPFTPGNGLATGSGAPRREAIHTRYRERIESFYSQESCHVAV